jgi:superfamily II DNA/RNA helicase
VSPSFAELGVPADLAAALDRRGLTQPFPIQSATLPDALAGRDLCGRAPTGSGKTIAFGLPLAARVGKARPQHPEALVLVPTRELAAQVREELHLLAAPRRRRVTAVYGGAAYGVQRTRLRQGVDILVACPGRLEDLCSRGDVFLDRARLVVLDEADRMADMGFLPSVRRLLDRTPAERQTLLFSATLDGDVGQLIERYQRDPVWHDVTPDEPEQLDVRHLFWRAERTRRVAITARLVAEHGPTVVFCRTRHGADRVARQLGSAGVAAVAIHGNRSQGQRERALAAFADGQAQALVATDVAARGIHVDDVACVVHFDPPADHKDYVHRSGRTGRAGATGTVVSLVTDEQVGQVRDLQRALELPTELDRPLLTDTDATPPDGGGHRRPEHRPERTAKDDTRGHQPRSGAKPAGPKPAGTKPAGTKPAGRSGSGGRAKPGGRGGRSGGPTTGNRRGAGGRSRASGRRAG